MEKQLIIRNFQKKIVQLRDFKKLSNYDNFLDVAEPKFSMSHQLLIALVMPLTNIDEACGGIFEIV